MENNNYQEESLNSSEEVVQAAAEQENNDNLGVGRSYECAFCKRGFNTAQALGGHMNIHRRDKACRNTPTSANSNKHEANHHFGPRFYHQMPASIYNQSVSHRFDHQSSLTYAAYFPAESTSSSRPLDGIHFSDHHDFDRCQQQHRNPLIPDDWRMSLSSDYTPMILEDLDKNKPDVIMSQKEELDLELRLGL